MHRDDEVPPPTEPDEPRRLSVAGGTTPDPEQGLLSAILQNPKVLDQVDPLVTGADFYHPRHEAIWNAIHDVAATGATPDPILVRQRLAATTREPRRVAEISQYVHHLSSLRDVFVLNAPTYATEVRTAARLRGIVNTGLKLQQIGENGIGGDLTAAGIALERGLDTLDDAVREHLNGVAKAPAPHVLTIDEHLAGDDPDHDDDTYDWVIPDLLERQDRLIITAGEGDGKSTLLRQIGVMAAAGLHPFTGGLITPITVLHIDVENSRRQSRRHYRPLRRRAGDRLDPNRMRIQIRVQGLDLTGPADRDWLSGICAAVNPDVLLIGPIYKLANGDPIEEKSAKPVALALDLVRAQTDCAIVLEGHAAKAPAGVRRRPHEPYGWSGWMRWPEFGLWLDRDGTLTHWRGAREDRSWPGALTRNGTWPWSPVTDGVELRWLEIKKAREKAAQFMSIRDVADLTGYSKDMVARTIGKGGRYAPDWAVLNGIQYDDDPQGTL